MPRPATATTATRRPTGPRSIRILRSLDLPIDQIREVLATDDPELVAKHLEMHRELLEDRLERHRGMLSFLERLIARKERIMPYEVQVKELPAQHVASVRKRTSLKTIGEDISAGFGQIWHAMTSESVAPSGPPFLVMHDVIAEETVGDVEICVPVAEPFPGAKGVEGRDVEAATAATTIHRGPYDQVGPAYHTLIGWIQEHGHEPAGPPREIYLTDPQQTPDPADYRTEVVFPIR